MFISIVVLAIVVLVACVVELRKTEENHLAETGFFFSGIVLIIMLMISIGSIVHNSNDIGVIRTQGEAIQANQERIKGFRKSVKQLMDRAKVGTLVNADMPIATLITSLTKIESRITESKIKLVNAKTSMASRKASPMWWVVYIYGEK